MNGQVTETRGEKRERLRRKRRGFKVTGRSVLLLSRIIISRALALAEGRHERKRGS